MRTTTCAVAIRDVVFGAAVVYRCDPDVDSDRPVALADGGVVEPESEETTESDTECVADRDGCPGPNADELPCFHCFQKGMT